MLLRKLYICSIYLKKSTYKWTWVVQMSTVITTGGRQWSVLISWNVIHNEPFRNIPLTGTNIRDAG